MARVEGKVALVTGGARGIGAASARRLAAEGAKVVITDIQEELGEETAKHIGASATFLKHDVTNEEEWRAVMDKVLEHLGRLDILVNNAGAGSGGSIEEADLEQWQFNHTVNGQSQFLGCKFGVEAMKKSGGGSIINMSSNAAERPSFALPAYASSKAAVIALTKAVAIHCAQQNYNIRCNAILPGPILTEMFEDVLANVPDREAFIDEQFRAGHAVFEFGAPDDIANAVLYLGSDEAKFVTGIELVVDGGYLL